MSLFKKKPETTNDVISQMQYEFENMRHEWEALKRENEKLKYSIPSIARQELENLARQNVITAAITYRDEVFLTEVHADRVKELKHKKQMLDQAIADCDKALTEIKGGEE